MHNPSTTIELSSKPSKSQPTNPPKPSKPRLAQNPRPNPQHYQPQEDEEDDQEVQFSPPRRVRGSISKTRNSDFCSKIFRNKAANLPILLILFLYIIDFAPICGVIYYSALHKQGFIPEMQDSLLDPLRFMSANLNADPIVDIQIKDKGFPCPSGFEALKLGNWPGTVAGCLCDNGVLLDSKCEDYDSEICKKDIPLNYPIEMFEWEDSLWCVKRAVLKRDYIRETVCPARYQECYPGGCFSGYCPITKIEIAPKGEANKKLNGRDKYVVLTREKGELPIINIQITFGEVPCFTQDLFAQNIKNSSYELSFIRESQCDKYGLNDQFTNKIASQTAFEAFAQNTFPYSVTNLPDFDKNAKITTAILSSMTRMKTAKDSHCLDINEKAVNDYGYTWLYSSSLITVLIAAVFTLFRGISICEIFAYRAPGFRADLFENINKLIPILYKLNFCTVIIMIIVLVSSQFIREDFQVLKEYFEEYKSLECFAGNQGNLVINDYLELIKKIEASFWVYSVLLASSLLSGLMALWLYIVKRKSN